MHNNSMENKRRYKETRLKRDKTGQYSITIPYWIAEEILEAKKGDHIKFEVNEKEVVIKKKNE